MAEKTGAGGAPQEYNEKNGQYEKSARVSNYSGEERFRQNTSYQDLLRADSLKKEQRIELPQTQRLPDEIFPRSLSAKWINQDIKMPDGSVAHFVEGSKLHNIEVFAGKGTKTPIRDVERLVETYGGKAEDWQKVKGIGVIVLENNEIEELELHWYQEVDIGKKEIKAKIR